jgi:type I restriction enzyme S subunit
MHLDIPLPPLQIQQEIVDILDRFEVLVHSFESGLPAEIAARHKQYEYYRDQLLTFQSKPPLQRGSESVANGGVE